jgi:hypothetical protein
VLERATAAATDVWCLTSFALAWRFPYGEDAMIREALARGETLAGNAADWLKLAEAWRDGGDSGRADAWDPAAVRRCLDAAASAAGASPLRGEIAAGYRRWLGDGARADALDAPVRDVDAIPRARTLAGWTADGRALFDRLRAQLDPERAKRLASADYGTGYAKHLDAIVELASTGQIPDPLPWYPGEVLELTRWGVGDKVDHVCRGFASVVLVLAAPVSDDANASLAPLIESAGVLGLDDELEGLLVWLAEVRDGPRPRAWALLGLILARARRAPDDPRLAAVVDDLIAAETEAAAEVAWLLTNADVPRSWMWRTTPYDGLRNDLWRSLIAERLESTTIRPHHLVDLAARLSGPPEPEGRSG